MLSRIRHKLHVYGFFMAQYASILNAIDDAIGSKNMGLFTYTVTSDDNIKIAKK